MCLQSLLDHTVTTKLHVFHAIISTKGMLVFVGMFVQRSYVDVLFDHVVQLVHIVILLILSLHAAHLIGKSNIELECDHSSLLLDIDRIDHINVILQLFVVGRFDLIFGQEGLVMVDMEIFSFFFDMVDVVDSRCFGRVDRFDLSLVVFGVPVQIQHSVILQIGHSPVSIQTI